MKKQAAFTLLELLVTTAVSALMMIAVTSLFITFLNTSYKSKISQRLREDGNNAMIEMISQIRSSGEVTSLCNDGVEMESISFIGLDGLTTTFVEDEDKIASSSAEHGTFYLTDTTEGADRLSNLIFNCYNSDDGARYISIAFTLKSGFGETNSITTSILNFSSGVALRN